jgi:hypothetical protein
MTADAQSALYTALAAAQADIRNPEKTRSADTGKYKYNYADIGDVLSAVLPVLSKHGLSVMQPTKIVDGSILLITRIAHKDGASIESEYPVCSLNGNHQAMGAAMTYARRYALTSLIGVAAVDDLDGEGAADVGEGPRHKMSASAANSEIDWASVQDAIDNAKDFAALDRHEVRIEERKGFWPDTYYHKARERVTFNRMEMADKRMRAAKDIDQLNAAMSDLEAILVETKKVPYEDIAGMYRKYERELEALVQSNITVPARSNGDAYRNAKDGKPAPVNVLAAG